MTDTPVLIATFARPEYTRLTFNAIKQAKPKKLYFYSNKARENNPDEIERNGQVRALVQEVDWDCELKTFFREEYVDLYASLWGAYDWLFDNEEQGIILEDDCVASRAFFDYCDKLLPKFKDDHRIWLLSGNNFFEHYNPNGYDYIFTRYPYQWGWATWRNRWQRILREDIPWEEMKKYDLFRQIYPSKRQADYHIKSEDRIYKSIQTRPAWDFTLGFTVKKEGGFGIIPSKNLVKNIGHFGTHSEGFNKLTHDRIILNSDGYSIENPPPFIVPDYKYDQYFFKNFYYKKARLLNRIKNKVKKIYRRLYNRLIGIK
jgi:hypothetical protein